MSSFRSDAAWSAAGTALPMLVGALTVPLLLRSLSANDFAVFALCFAVTSFAPSFDLGIARTTLRRVAALEASTTPTRAELVTRCLRRAWIVGWGVGALMAGVAYLLTRAGAPAAHWHDATGPLCIAALGVPLAVAGNTQRSVLEACRMFATSAGIRIALGLLTAVVPLLLSWWTNSVELLCLSLLLLRLVVVVQQQRMLARAGLWVSKPLPLAGDGEPAAGFWSESMWYALLTPLALAMSGFDRFIIAWVGGFEARELAVLLAPQEIALRAIILPATLVPALLVRLATRSTPDTGVQELSNRLARAVGATVFLACSLVCVLVPEFAGWIFHGVDATAVAEVTQVLSVGIFSSAIAQLPMAQLSARGLIRDVAVTHALQFPLYLLALGPLIAHFGVAGGAWAWSGRIVIDTVMLCWLARNRLPAVHVVGLQVWHAAGVLTLAGLVAWK